MQQSAHYVYSITDSLLHLQPLWLYNSIKMHTLFDTLFEHTLQELMFTSTLPTSYKENRKADIKNYNLPILQFLYHGDSTIELHCLLTKEPAFVNVPNWATGDDKRRFRIDFNHIRQKCNELRQGGKSLDKMGLDPSALFREKRLDYPGHQTYLLEFLAIMPITTEQHSYITQDSAKHDITLNCFPKYSWPWALRSESNWKRTCARYNIMGISYREWIGHLSSTEAAPLHERLQYNHPSGHYVLN